jgi:hypothetical protein
MAPILKPVGLLIGWLFLIQALFFLLSALAGRGDWLKPASRGLAWIFQFLASIFGSIRGIASVGDGSSGNEFEQVGCLFVGAVFMLFPCVGVLAVYYWLDPLHEANEVLGLWDVFTKFLNKYDLLGLIYLALLLLVSYYLVEKILQGAGRLAGLTAGWLSTGEKVWRQLGTAALCGAIGAVGIFIGSQAPTAEEYTNLLLTPTARPTSAIPTATLAWYQTSDDFSGVDLRGIQLDHARLDGKDFTGANLANANLRGAFLQKSNLEKADLRQANMRQAWLYGANLKDANLSGANLKFADLSNADLTGAEVEIVQFVECCLGGTRLPDGRLYDGRFNSPCDAAAMESLLDSDGLDPGEQFQVKHYLQYLMVSREEWQAGQAWAKENREALMAESDAWYAKHWPGP